MSSTNQERGPTKLSYANRPPAATRSQESAKGGPATSPLPSASSSSSSSSIMHSPASAVVVRSPTLMDQLLAIRRKSRDEQRSPQVQKMLGSIFATMNVQNIGSSAPPTSPNNSIPGFGNIRIQKRRISKTAQ
eukprot:ANDGO_07014.mRNA.1 hypothetical protein